MASLGPSSYSFASSLREGKKSTKKNRTENKGTLALTNIYTGKEMHVNKLQK